MLSALTSMIWGETDDVVDVPDEEVTTTPPGVPKNELIVEDDWIFVKPKDTTALSGKRKRHARFDTDDDCSVTSNDSATSQGCQLASSEQEDDVQCTDERMDGVVATQAKNCQGKAVAGRLKTAERLPLKELSAKTNQEMRRTTRSSLNRKNKVAARPHCHRPSTKQLGRIAGKHSGMVGKRGS